MLQPLPSRRRLLTLVTLILLLITATDALATGPNGDPGLQVLQPKLHYQARLVDPATGQPRPDGIYTLHFKFYTTDTGGSSVWAENWTGPVTNGMVSTMLGSSALIDPGLFESGTVWLGVAVDSEPEMTPRQEIGWVPKAIHAYQATYATNADHAADATTADDCDTVDGKDASYFATSSHTHDYEPLAYGYVRYDAVPMSGSGNYSVTWNDTYDRYEITIDDYRYYGPNVTCMLTLTGGHSTCPGGTSIRESSVSNKLLVYIVKSDGKGTQCSFNFMVWDNPRY